ncbi:MAG: type II secretion system protein GspM [Methylococcales bacterium]|nr:type II secretion system protein GspM [Methylococcales bacterium]
MMTLVNWTRERGLAVALLAGIVMLVVAFVLTPLLSWHWRLQEQREDLEFRLQRYLRIVQNRTAIEANLEQIQAQYAQLSYLMRHDNPAVAAAELQQAIKGQLTGVNAQLTSTQVLPPRPDGNFTRIGVKVRLRADIEAVRSIVYELEQTEPLYLIEELDIRPYTSTRNRNSNTNTGLLNVNFSAVGFMLRESP